jgi:hypothetical protein
MSDNSVTGIQSKEDLTTRKVAGVTGIQNKEDLITREVA